MPAPSQTAQFAPAPLPRLHEDSRILVVDKPPGLLVHRTALDAHEHDSVVDRLERETGCRPWPVHRLDKGTSGVLVLALDAEAARMLGAAFEAGGVAKRYLALVRGWPADEGRIDHPLARDPERPSAGQPMRSAVTRFAVRRRFDWPFAVDARHPSARYALIEAVPETGRRHQIRRHLKHIGHPLIGDATHGKGPHNRAVAAWLGVARLWLHAARIELPHPDDGRALRVDAPPGDAWVRLLGGVERDGPGTSETDLERGTMRRTCVGPVSGGDAPEAPC
ncbi:MAG: pseudouridine synthase [Burkholderiales bacterium]|nr:pseudouridine synthase [Burkholderiales bacterium]